MTTFRFFNITLFFIIQFLILTGKVHAVTANPEPVIYFQPDGSKITILLKGDEFIHWAVTTDGYTVMTNSEGTYQYGTVDKTGALVYSGIQANDPANRSQPEIAWLNGINKGLFFSKLQVRGMKAWLNTSGSIDAPMTGGFPSTGTRKLLMILANFSNTNTTNTQADFTNCMNQANYNGTGSFRDYYLEVSYGQLTVNTTVTIWVSLPNTHDYYGPQDNWGEFAFDAITAASNLFGVDFSEYDNNLDGIVDGISIIHQGQGQEETGNVTDIWSHSWSLSSAGYSAAQRTFDGVQVDAYTTMPERNATGVSTIGVMCHEFCHNLGMPDFYDTDYSINGYYTGTGTWDLMAGGSWNGVSGTKPAHPNGWIKVFLNWTSPVVLSTAQTVTLRNAQAFPDIIRFDTKTPNEYFLCENRQQTGFDIGIPGHGLIIYHVDESYILAQMNANTINTTAHQGLYPVCANSNGNPPVNYGIVNSPGCPFPGTGNKTSFSDTTAPHSHSWDGINTEYPVSNIFEYTPTREVTFCFLGCSTSDDPIGFIATTVSLSQIDINWVSNLTNCPVLIAFSSTPAFGTPLPGTNYASGDSVSGGGTVIDTGTDTIFHHIGLSASTTVYYKAWSLMPGVTFSTGVTATATSLCGTISSFPWIENFENEGVMPECWTQEQINNSGLNWLFPTGNGGIYPANAFSGSYNACIKDKTVAENKTRLISPALNLTVTSNPHLSFWHTQLQWGSDQDQLSVYYKTSAGAIWTILGTYTSNIITWTQETLSLPNPTATYYISFEGNAKYGFGVCIDDVQIASACTTYLPVSVVISASANPIIADTLVIFTACAVNGGQNPGYEWEVNGLSVTGINTATYSYTPGDADAVSCILASDAACVVNNPAVSNSVVMSVFGLPTAIFLQNQYITSTKCFGANQTIMVAGGGSGFIVESGGSATMVAGEKIIFLPGTLVQPGGYLLGYITTTGEFCGSQIPSMATVTGGEETIKASFRHSLLKVYPNPSSGAFVLELTLLDPVEKIQVYIYNMSGEKVWSTELTGEKQFDILLPGIPPGLYLIKVITGKNSGNSRIVMK